jgi:tetraacyldisaccharide 4'-kinase
VIEQILKTSWYGKGLLSRSITILLLPLTLIFYLLVALRRAGYEFGLLQSSKVSVPLIIVGNITVGGAGKTPLVIALVKWCIDQGFSPAVVSRGYGREDERVLLRVDSDSDVRVCGDEPLLIAQASGVPVYVGSDRVAAAEMALQDKYDGSSLVDIIISDDGMQHYSLERDMEIAVVDGEYALGNRLLLPAGPLREPASRLDEVDAVVVAGNSFLQPQPLYKLVEPNSKKTTDYFSGQRVHAVAGIGYPERFFTMLRNLGMEVIPHPFSDHHQYNRAELLEINTSDNLPMIVTEKDAVKCTEFANELTEVWVLPVAAIIDDKLDRALRTCLKIK